MKSTDKDMSRRRLGVMSPREMSSSPVCLAGTVHSSSHHHRKTYHHRRQCLSVTVLLTTFWTLSVVAASFQVTTATRSGASVKNSIAPSPSSKHNVLERASTSVPSADLPTTQRTPLLPFWRRDESSSGSSRNKSQPRQEQQRRRRQQQTVTSDVPTFTVPPPPLLTSSSSTSISTQTTTQQQQQQPLKQRGGVFSKLLPFQQDSSSSNSKNVNSDAYERRKQEWASKYTSVDALRRTFGSNKHFWGDLDPATARRLYKSLLPKALLELYNFGVHPSDLAPLAYRARVAAKLYARERCEVPARVAANLYDGFRQWRRYGSFDTTGMSYQQIWNKYSAVIQEELNAAKEGSPNQYDYDAQDITAKICLKILERSCQTNEMVDKLVLRGTSEEAAKDKRDLQQVSDILEEDVRQLLQGVQPQQQQKTLSPQRIRALRTLARIKQRAAGMKQQQQQQDRAAKVKSQEDDNAKKQRDGSYSQQRHQQKQQDEMASSPRSSSSSSAQPWQNRRRAWENRKRPERRQ